MENKEIEEIYASGEITLEKLKKINEKFIIECAFCHNRDISIMVKGDNDGYCESCSSPYARATLKCKQCGQAISIRD